MLFSFPRTVKRGILELKPCNKANGSLVQFWGRKTVSRKSKRLSSVYPKNWLTVADLYTCREWEPGWGTWTSINLGCDKNSQSSQVRAGTSEDSNMNP